MSSLIDLASQLKDKDFDGLPIIDLSNATSTDESLRRAVAEDIRSACLSAGFFFGTVYQSHFPQLEDKALMTVKNHSVPPETVQNAFEAAQTFFDQPASIKESVDISKSTNFRGYMKLLSENNDPTRKGEMHEAWNIGLDPSLGLGGGEAGTGKREGRGGGEGELVHSENLWPDEDVWEGAATFRQANLDYYTALLKLGRSLFPLFALALNLPEDFFDDKTRHPAAIMRMLHYPGVPLDQVKEENPGIGAHTDFECFTILAQGGPGLQVRNRKGDWLDAPIIPDTFVINIGDQFARWTNDLFISTPHRVLPPQQTRYSIPFFFGCDHDVPLIPPDTCVSEDRPNRYEVMTAGAYVHMRLSETYGAKA